MADNDSDKPKEEPDAQTPVEQESASGTSAPAPGRSGRGGAFVLGAVVIIALVGAASALVVFEPRLRTKLATWLDSDAARMRTTLDARLTALGQRLDALPPPADVRRLEALESRVAALPPPMDAARVKALEDRAAALDAKLVALSGAASTASALPPGALALVALARRLENGRPFAVLAGAGQTVLAGLGATAARDDLSALAPYAARGVPTALMLARTAGQLDAPPPVAEKAPTPAKGVEKAEQTAAGWWDRIKARVQGLVTIRRIGDGASAPAVAPVAPKAVTPAIDAFAAGDVAAGRAVLAALDTAALTSDAAAARARLIEDADARLRADRLTAALDAALAALP